GEALAYVWSTNVQRRHLNSGQVAIALAKRENLDTEYAAAIEATRKAATARPNAGRPPKDNSRQIVDANKDNTARTDHKLAESAGTNRSYVAKARKIVEEAPELADKVERGEMTLSQASTEMRRDEKRKD